MALLLPASPLVGPPYLMALAEAVLELRPTTLHVLDSLGYVRDISGNRWDATYTGSPVLASPPLPTLPRGVTFSGTGQYAATATSVPTPSASVSVMAVYSTSDATAATRYFAGRRATSQFTWDLRMSSLHNLQFIALQSGGSTHAQVAAPGAVSNDGLPHLVLGTFDGTTIRCGRDGLASDISTTLTGSWHLASTSAISIASGAATGVGLFPGTIYHVAYWADRIITDTERFRLNWIMRRG